jgi:hypothetical protein
VIAAEANHDRDSRGAPRTRIAPQQKLLIRSQTGQNRCGPGTFNNPPARIAPNSLQSRQFSPAEGNRLCPVASSVLYLMGISMQSVTELFFDRRDVPS